MGLVGGSVGGGGQQVSFELPWPSNGRSTRETEHFHEQSTNALMTTNRSLGSYKKNTLQGVS